MKKKITIWLCIMILVLSGCGKSAGEETETGDVVGAGEETETGGVVEAGDDAITGDATEKEEESTMAEAVVQDNFQKAAEAVDNMLIGWNLGNSFDATGDWILNSTQGKNNDFETAWGNPLTQKSLFTKLKNLGFNAVRIPITWRYHFDENGNIDEEWMARIQEVVDFAMEADLYCIINIHHDTGADGWLRASTANYNKNNQIFKTLWTQIAARFKDYPDKLIFEGFNEMLDENSEWNNPGSDAIKAINDYNQCFVDVVRATGGNNAFRNLVCCTYAASTSGRSMKDFVVPVDSAENHLIAEVHYYSPYEFITDEGVTWTEPISKYSDYVEQTINNIFANIKNELASKNIPVIIGEFACDDKGNTEDRIKWYTHVIEKANEQNITCFIWDNGNGYCMGHIDRVGDNDAFPEIIEKCVMTAK